MNLNPGVGRMESFLRGRRDDGAKLLVVYITGGYEGGEAAVETAAAAGADAIEIGIPFSDPVMDGHCGYHHHRVAHNVRDGRWESVDRTIALYG